MEENQKALQELVEKLQTSLNKEVEDLKKTVDNNKFQIKRVE